MDRATFRLVSVWEREAFVMTTSNWGIAGRWMSVIFSLLAVWTAMPAARAADAEWKVDLVSVKITPERPVFLAGYASRNKPFTKVEADLYAKALALEDRQGQRVVLVTTDLVGLAAAVAEPICERLRDKAGLKREQILLNSSHTHTGPMLVIQAPDDDPAGDRLTAGELQRNVEYTRQLQDKIVEVVQQATAKLEPAKLSWSVGVCPFVMNRREFTANGVILGVNPRGLADRTVPMLRIDTPDGKLRAVLFGAAVHGTTLGGNDYELCGDYAGFAQAYVEEKHPSVQAMFMLGCAGDANPYPRGSMAIARAHGETLGKEVCRLLESKLRPVRGPLHIAFDKAALPLQAPPSREELKKLATRKGGMQTWVAQKMLAALDRGKKLPDHYDCPIAVWQFGDDLTLVGLAGEVVVDYVSMLEKALGPRNLWLAAYCNDVFGYLPSARVLREGGYETRGLYTGGIGYFDAKAQDVLVEKVRELATKVGRKLPAE
jgi:neutral ceramidase